MKNYAFSHILKKNFYAFRTYLTALYFIYNIKRFLRGEGTFIGALVAECIVSVGYRNYPSPFGNIFPVHSTGIAFSVEAFMVVVYNGVGILQPRYWHENSIP